jgi:hypothetical protein
MLTTLLPSVSWMSRQHFNISQSYWPPRPVTGIALLFYFTTPTRTWTCHHLSYICSVLSLPPHKEMIKGQQFHTEWRRQDDGGTAIPTAAQGVTCGRVHQLVHQGDAYLSGHGDYFNYLYAFTWNNPQMIALCKCSSEVLRPRVLVKYFMPVFWWINLFACSSEIICASVPVNYFDQVL